MVPNERSFCSSSSGSIGSGGTGSRLCRTQFPDRSGHNSSPPGPSRYSLIMTLTRWESTAYASYIRMAPETLHAGGGKAASASII